MSSSGLQLAICYVLDGAPGLPNVEGLSKGGCFQRGAVSLVPPGEEVFQVGSSFCDSSLPTFIIWVSQIKFVRNQIL